MTVNFKNSAGTDLDSLFSITNTNAGALGFKEAGGQDLGNRFAVGSLGTNVGYKNNAGTDIGYLRGKVVAPQATITLTRDKDDWGISRGDSTSDREDSDNLTAYRQFSYTMQPKITITNGQPVTSVKYQYQFKSNAVCGISGTIINGTSYNCHNKWTTFHEVTTTTLSHSLLCTFKALYESWGSSISCGDGEYHSRVVVTITNSAGSITLTSNTLYTNEDR